MKAITQHLIGSIGVTFGLAACVAGAVSAAQSIEAEPVIEAEDGAEPVPPITRIAVPPPPPPPPVVEPRYDNYLDAPQTPGTWTYGEEPGESFASFGEGETRDGVRFIVRCDKSSRLIGLARISQRGIAGPRAIEITTETTTRALTVEPLAGQASLIAIELSPSDSLFDAMAITKGRIAIAVAGESTLYLPAWVEISRVIEDCR